MRRFQIKPADRKFPPVEIIAHDAAAVLNLVHRLGCGEADIERDGAYAFSVRLEGGSYWCISQRRPIARPVQAGHIASAFGRPGLAPALGQPRRLAP